MAAKRLPMRKIREVLRLKWEAGLSHRAIAAACGIGLGTVTEYLGRARVAGVGWPLGDEWDDAALEKRLFARTEVPRSERALPDPVWIHQELKRREMTLLVLWMEYIEAHPEGLRYSQFCARYRQWSRQLRPSMRQRHLAGEKAFVDFSGRKPVITDSRTGETREVELFVGTLGASSYTYAEACAGQDLVSWIGAHARMNEYFGGSAAIYVPDNLKAGVTRPCRYEPLINRTYSEMAEHYGAVVIPARVGRAKDKAKVESNVLVVQRWILARLRNRTFFSLAELNLAIRELLVELNGRPMRELKLSRRELFERVDRPALKPLPAGRYELAEWKTCRLNIDYHVEAHGNYYSAPHPLLKEPVDVRVTYSTVEVFHKSRRVASHRRLFGRGQQSTHSEHMPSSHRAHAEWTPSGLIRWAERHGPQTAALVRRVLADRPHPEQGFRSCLGIMRLGKKYGEQRLEAACARAGRLGAYSYTTVKNILSAGVEQLPLPGEMAPRPRAPRHDNIRGGSYYE
jgi:transposase